MGTNGAEGEKDSGSVDKAVELSQELKDLRPKFDVPTSADADTHTVDTSAPNFAVNKLRNTSNPDITGYGRRGEYTRKPEPAAVLQQREAAYRERSGLPPRQTSFEPAKMEKPGLLSRIAGRLRGNK